MIVRIMGEGQYTVDDAKLATLNDLDDAVVAAVEGKDEVAFAEQYAALLGYVRAEGTPLAGDDLSQSDVLFPPSDLTFAEAEAGEEFHGEGLIPDPGPAATA